MFYQKRRTQAVWLHSEGRDGFGNHNNKLYIPYQWWSTWGKETTHWHVDTMRPSSHGRTTFVLERAPFGETANWACQRNRSWGKPTRITPQILGHILEADIPMNLRSTKETQGLTQAGHPLKQKHPKKQGGQHSFGERQVRLTYTTRGGGHIILSSRPSQRKGKATTG